jgi:UDP-2,3-diacylglucosamine pyrophosphatase LpxH
MKRNLLIVSDVHLGCDLVQHIRPNAPLRAPASLRRDEELCALLDWYREHPLPDAPWRLIFAGDLIDFSGMAIGAAPTSEVCPDERKFGLRASELNSVEKLRRVAMAHADVFAALSCFLKAGNDLAIVRGNHDVDLFWPAVQRELLGALDVCCDSNPDVHGCVEFFDWFYYEPGRIYLEHGHHYDPYCSHRVPLAPLDPRGGNVLAYSLSDLLKRYVVNPTQGLTEGGHENAAMLDYFRLVLHLGWGEFACLIVRFVFAVGRALLHALQHKRSVVASLEAQQQKLLEELAQRHSLELTQLEPLRQNWMAPATSLRALLASLMLDRLLLAFALLVATTTITQCVIPTGPRLMAVALLGSSGTLLWRRLAQARGSVDSSARLRTAALAASQKLNAPLVVMGHTHAPEVSCLGGVSEYINVGGWFEVEPMEGFSAVAATRTHLVVTAETHRATLYTWGQPESELRFEHVYPGTSRTPSYGKPMTWQPTGSGPVNG